MLLVFHNSSPVRHLPRVYEVSAVFQWQVRLHLQRVLSEVCNQDGTADGRVFVAEEHVVDDARERSEHLVLVWSPLSTVRFQITCTFEL